MSDIQHGHSFAHTNYGYKCELANCTATITNAEIAANMPSGPAAAKHVTLTDVLNQTWKKAGH